MSSPAAVRACSVLSLPRLLLLPLLSLVLLCALQCATVPAALLIIPYEPGTGCNVASSTLPAIDLPNWQFNVSQPCVPYTTPSTLFGGLTPHWIAMSCAPGDLLMVSLYYYTVDGGCPALSATASSDLHYISNFTYGSVDLHDCDTMYWLQRQPMHDIGRALSTFQCDGDNGSPVPPALYVSAAGHQAHGGAGALLFAILLTALFSAL